MNLEREEVVLLNITPSEKQVVSMKFDSFIKKCCRNEARNLYNHEKLTRERERLVSDFTGIEIKVVSAEIKISDFVIEGNEIFVEDISLLNALQKIDSRDRELILLKFFMGYSDEDISKEMNMKRRTVNYQKNRIINKLKKYMEG